MEKENNKWLIKKVTKNREISKLGIFEGSSEFIKKSIESFEEFSKKPEEEINHILFIPMNDVYDRIAESLVATVQNEASDLSNGLCYCVEFFYIEKAFGIKLNDENVARITEKLIEREEVAQVFSDNKEFDVTIWIDFAPNYEDEDEDEDEE